MGAERAPKPFRPAGEEGTIVCRCEDLTLSDLREVIRAGAHTMEEVKRLTRCGMGPCQGKTCRQLLAAELARELGLPLASVALPTFRPTTKPVKLSLLVDDEEPQPWVTTPWSADGTMRRVEP